MGSLKTLRRFIPKPVKPFVIRQYFRAKNFVKKTRNFFYIIPDLIEVKRGKRDPLTPPERMIFVGIGDYKAIGQEFYNYFITLGGLKKEEAVLEVGCGIGRMAVPLIDYLTDGGRYEGFDIVKEGITWCRKNITHIRPNFNFQLANVYNSAYNPNGKYSASGYVFPYKDKTFDFIFLTSVFTHMTPKDMGNYLSEISRVLKKGGRCFITYFLLNKESVDLIDSGAGAISFTYKMGEYRIDDTEVPDSAVAFNEDYILHLYAANNLEITNPKHYGSWCGRKDFLSFQDIVIAVKK